MAPWFDFTIHCFASSGWWLVADGVHMKTNSRASGYKYDGEFVYLSKRPCIIDLVRLG